MKDKRGLALFTSFFLFAFYVVIVMYVIISVLNLNTANNFVCGLVFEIIGFFILLTVITCNLFGKAIKTGYLIPIIMSTVVYTILLDALNFAGMLSLSNPIFTLLHLVLLFITLLIVMPMLVMGKR